MKWIKNIIFIWGVALRCVVVHCIRFMWKYFQFNYGKKSQIGKSENQQNRIDNSISDYLPFYQHSTPQNVFPKRNATSGSDLNKFSIQFPSLFSYSIFNFIHNSCYYPIVGCIKFQFLLFFFTISFRWKCHIEIWMYKLCSWENHPTIQHQRMVWKKHYELNFPIFPYQHKTINVLFLLLHSSGLNGWMAERIVGWGDAIVRQWHQIKGNAGKTIK